MNFGKSHIENFNSQLYSDCFDGIKIFYGSNKTQCLEFNHLLRQKCSAAKKQSQDWGFIEEVEEIRKESYHLEAKDVFDSYLIYLEWNRPAKKKFYLPRRKQLKTLVEDLQDLVDRKIDFLGRQRYTVCSKSFRKAFTEILSQTRYTRLGA